MFLYVNSTSLLITDTKIYSKHILIYRLVYRKLHKRHVDFTMILM